MFTITELSLFVAGGAVFGALVVALFGLPALRRVRKRAEAAKTGSLPTHLLKVFNDAKEEALRLKKVGFSRDQEIAQLKAQIGLLRTNMEDALRANRERDEAVREFSEEPVTAVNKIDALMVLASEVNSQDRVADDSATVQNTVIPFMMSN